MRTHLTVGLSLLMLATNALSTAFSQTETPVPEVEALVPEVIADFPHDPDSFTQGFVLDEEGRLFESAGLYGQSDLREVDPETGDVLRSVDVPEEFFAEGLALVDDRLIQITWREETAFAYDAETFELLETYTYSGEGWGLCYDGSQIFMSDGSPTITTRDAETFEAIEQIEVTFEGQPVDNLNELECVGDSVYANIWQTDYIVRIDKSNGVITGVIFAGGLLTPEEAEVAQRGGVLNGIAYNPETETFLITGKLWPRMFEVRFVPRQTPNG